MTCVQAPAIAKMGAEVTQHNKLLLQLAKSFPASHSGATVYTYDFGAAFDQASFSGTTIAPEQNRTDVPLSCMCHVPGDLLHMQCTQWGML